MIDYKMLLMNAKRAICSDSTVRYNGSDYKIKALIMRYNKRADIYYYTAELQNIIQPSCLVYPNLKDIIF